MSGAIGGSYRLTLASGSTSLTAEATAQISKVEFATAAPSMAPVLNLWREANAFGIAERDGEIKRLSGLNTVFFAVPQH